MGIAALILGILSVILGFIPFCNWFALLPAFIGLILGIVEIVTKKKKNEKVGMGIAGTVLSAVALVIIFVVNILTAAVIVSEANNIVYDYDYNSLYNYSSSYYNYNF